MKTQTIAIALSVFVLLPSSVAAKTKLGELACGANEIPKFDGSDWVCADDLTTLAQAIDDIGDFGCSATQQDNSVLIECGDGTAGVIAGAGTVVMYPEGLIGQVPPIEYPNGAIVAVDGNGVILGDVVSFDASSPPRFVDTSFADSSLRIYSDIRFFNLIDNQQVIFSARVGEILFLSEDCAGPAFVEQNTLINIDGQYFVAAPGAQSGDLLIKSTAFSANWTLGIGNEPLYLPGGECRNDTFSVRDQAGPAVEYFMPPEFTNAAYPVTVQQLP